jgi:hypothetical protein
MSAQRKETNQELIYEFRIIKGGLYSPTKREKRINDFWTFCHSTFWSNEIFTELQEDEFRELISAYFEKGKDSDETFSQLVQRAVLAKRYVKRRNSRYVAKPADWLNINYKTGLKGTEAWYKEVEQQRLSVPTYNEGLEFLAEAVLSWATKRNVLEVSTYREKFIELKHFDLLFLYTNAIMHFQYINY